MCQSLATNCHLILFWNMDLMCRIWSTLRTHNACFSLLVYSGIYIFRIPCTCIKSVHNIFYTLAFTTTSFLCNIFTLFFCFFYFRGLFSLEKKKQFSYGGRIFDYTYNIIPSLTHTRVCVTISYKYLYIYIIHYTLIGNLITWLRSYKLSTVWISMYEVIYIIVIVIHTTTISILALVMWNIFPLLFFLPPRAPIPISQES